MKKIYALFNAALKNKRNRFKLVAAACVFFVAMVPEKNLANVTITPPSLTVYACSGIFPTASYTLNNIVITENASGDISTFGTLILTAPANFEFTSAGAASFQSSRNVTGVTVTLTNATTITVTISGSGTNKIDIITLSGIQVRGINLASGPSNIIRAAGGTSVIAGDAAGAVHGILTSQTAALPSGSLAATETSGTTNNDNIICSGSTVTFTATSGFTIYNFKVNGTSVQSGASNTYNSTILTNGASVTVDVTNSSGCTSTFGPQVITVNAVPTISGTLTVCPGLTTQLTGSGTPDGTVPWTSSNTSVATISNTGLVTGVAAGSTTITYKNSNGCTKSTTVTVSGISLTSATGTDNQSICSAGSSITTITYSITGATSSSISWSPSSPGVTSTPGSSTFTINGSTSNSAAGVYTYTISISGGSCSGASITGKIFVFSPGTLNPIRNGGRCGARIDGSPVTCADGSPATYLWYQQATGGGPLTLIQDSTNEDLYPSGDATKFKYTRTAICGSCRDSVKMNQPVSAYMAITTTQTNVTCFGGSDGSITATVAGGIPPFTYIWTNKTTSSTYSTTDIDAGLVAGTYNLTVKDSANCNTNVSVTITQSSSLPSATISVSGTNPVCSGSASPNIIFTGTGGTAGYKFTYDINGGTFITTASGNPTVSVSVSTAVAGTYIYTLDSVTDSYGCKQPVTGQSITVTVNPLTVITTQPVGATYCLNALPADLSVSATGTAPLTYQWYSNTTNSNVGGTAIGGQTASTYTPPTTVANTYYYYVVVTGGCGIVPSSVAVVKVAANSWTGDISSDWNTSGNWCSGSVPTAATDVSIGVVTNLPVLSSDAAVHNLVILAGATVNLSGYTLTVNGTLNSGGTTGRFIGSASSGLTTAGSGTAYFDPSNNILKTLTLNAGTLTLGNALNITAGTYASPGTLTVNTSSTLTTGDLLTLKSDASGDARVAESYGTISGNVIVERYFPPRRAWRFVTAPVNSSQSINAAWQEGQVNPGFYPTDGTDWFPGYGTEITYNNIIADGYDWNTQLNPSIRVWDPPTNNFQPIGSTYININNYPGYYLFVRGSRAIALSQAIFAPPDQTVLRVKGTLNETGSNLNKVFSTSGSIPIGGFYFVGNPYASAINLTNILDGSRPGGYNQNTFWVWDPVLAGTFGVGAYVSYTKALGWVPAGGSYAQNDPPVIQSGQAFMVQSDGTSANISLEFRETDKYSTGKNVFGKQQQNNQIVFYTNLMTPSGNSLTLMDGVAATFAENNSAGIDKKDVSKKWNTQESIGLFRNNTWQSIEFRPIPVLTDTLFYTMYDLKPQSYVLQVMAKDIPATFPRAWLVDKYLNTKAAINIDTAFSYDFTANTDTNSYRNRFMLVLRRTFIATPIPVSKIANQANPVITGNAASISTQSVNVSVHPNPVKKGEKVMLQFKSMNEGRYQATTTNALGKTLTGKTIIHNGGSNTYSIQTGRNWAAGNYLIIITNENGFKALIKLVVEK